jgi:hypothetical protein
MNKDLDIKEKKIVTESELKNTQGIMYDFGDDEPITKLPDANEILDEIIKILECMNTEEMKLLRESNKELFEQLMEEKFPDFSYKYLAVFQMILSGEDITPLFKMLDVISQVNSGKSTVEQGEKDVGKYLTKFLPDGLLEKLESGELNKKGNKKNIKKNNRNHK